MLTISNLHAETAGKAILKGITRAICSSEILRSMANGTVESTLGGDERAS